MLDTASMTTEENYPDEVNIGADLTNKCSKQLTTFITKKEKKSVKITVHSNKMVQFIIC